MPSKSAAITFPVVLMPRIQFASTFEPSASGAPCVSRGRIVIPPPPVVFGVPVPGLLEPGLDRELREVELGWIAERHIRRCAQLQTCVAHVQRDRDRVRVRSSVIRLVRETVGAVIARGRRVREATVRSQSKAAVVTSATKAAVNGLGPRRCRCPTRQAPQRPSPHSSPCNTRRPPQPAPHYLPGRPTHSRCP